jgi:transketolase
MREAFGNALVALGQRRSDLVVLDADLCNSTRAIYFKEAYPERFIQCGIAEQNMIGVAAGMAQSGLLPFVTSFAVFLTRRVYDQLIVAVAYPQVDMKIIGAYGGLSSGKAGPTHQAIEDLALMRAVPNMCVLAPADDRELEEALIESCEFNGPVYIRVNRNPVSSLLVSQPRRPFCIGEIYEIRSGVSDVLVFATGVMSARALEAAALLERAGLDVTVVHVPSLKPCDSRAIADKASRKRLVVSLEDHSVIGGLGAVVSEALAAQGLPVRHMRIGVSDVFCESGDEQDLHEKYGLSPRKVADQILRELNWQADRCEQGERS